MLQNTADNRKTLNILLRFSSILLAKFQSLNAFYYIFCYRLIRLATMFKVPKQKKIPVGGREWKSLTGNRSWYSSRFSSDFPPLSQSISAGRRERERWTESYWNRCYTIHLNTSDILSRIKTLSIYNIDMNLIPQKSPKSSIVSFSISRN